MNITKTIAKHFRSLYFGGNWTFSNLKDQTADINWELAIARVGDLNTIATLVYHLNYYVVEVSKVLEGGILEAKDQFSFQHPPIQSEADWKNMLNNVFEDGKRFGDLIEGLDDSILDTTFSDEKYGSYYRNLHGIIEHAHYHLGQIAVIKKLLKADE